MEQQALELIAGKLDTALKTNGYALTWEDNDAEGQLSTYALLTGKDAVYGVFYETTKKRFLLRTCGLSVDEPDNKWVDLSIWLFDPEIDEVRDAESIANDFIDSLTTETKTITKNKKRTRTDDENNVDPIFFINRFLTIFPELKEDLQEHRFYHTDILPVYFIREKVAQKVIAAWTDRYNGGLDSKLSERLCTLLNDCYKNGDLDTRAIITQIILNSIQDAELELAVEKKLSPSLCGVWKAGRKYRDNPAKPEKEKQKGGLLAQMSSNVLGR